MKKKEKMRCPAYGWQKLFRIMRLSVILLLAGMMNVTASVYSQTARLSVDARNKKIVDVLTSIENQSEFRFFYKNEQVDVNRKVSVKAEDTSVENILETVFEGTRITYKFFDDKLILLSTQKVGDSYGEGSQNQEKSVSGKVTDESGEPLPGVTILIKGTTIGTVTNLDGEYFITNLPEDASLLFSFVGMRSQEVVVEKQTSINITLVADAIGIDEVIAVGYGSQKKSDLTGAVYSVRAEKLETLPNTNIMQGLQGSVPGLNISNEKSAPGEAPKIRIRGENSLSASNNPLIILDGIPFEGNMNDINPGDIETASVLKDASSAAIYGARAANGVIIITTKRGKTGKVRVNYRGYYGIQTIAKKMDLLSGPEYIKFLQDYNRFAGKTDLSPEALLMTDELAQYQAGIETDWQDLVFRTAPQQDHQVSLSGGSEKTSYYTSLGYLNQQGIVENSGMKRYSIRSNVDHQINDWIKMGVNIQLTNKDLGGYKPSITNAIKISPYGKVKDENGRYTDYPQKPQTYYSNPYANDGTTVDNETKRAFVNVFGEVEVPFIKGLSYRLNYGIDYYNREYGNYYPSYTLTGRQSNGLANIENYSQERLTWENIVKYKKEIGNHNFDVTGLYSRESETYKESKLEGKGFVNDDNLYHYIGSAEQKTFSSKLTETDLVSYMGRINYNFANKYFFTATGRADGYSGFGENNKYGFFPSVALGWIPTQESFFQNSEALSVIDYLKIRASLGENGNMGISPYQTLDNFAKREYVYGDNETTVNGVVISTIGNPDLKWESTISFNLGLDYAILDNRISGNIEFYKSQSKNLLMQRQVPVMNGYTSIWYNVGKTENKGFEFNLNTVNVRRGDFEWTTNFNFSVNRDKIVELRGDGNDDLANKWFVGEPLRVHYDYNMIGIWQKDDDIANSHMPSAKPGTPIIRDVSEDGKITSADKEILGSKLPDWVGGMTNTFTYNNWSLSVYLNTVQGILKENKLLDPNTWLPTKNTNYLNVPYWTEERPSNTYVTPGYDDTGNTLRHFFYQDASYVRIQDVSLSYTFPKQMLDKVGVQNLKVFLSGKNLYTFTDWDGYDPEADDSFAPYPNSRTIIMGVNLSF
uniref:TonB-dependent receptor n=1 Tax=uncultured Draconibacterium sp. TaxID=1573823 RepID=UPI00321633B1